MLSLYFNWSIRNCRTIVGHLPFANLTCEMALIIALRSGSVVSKLYILLVLTLRTKYSEISEKSFGLGTYE